MVTIEAFTEEDNTKDPAEFFKGIRSDEIINIKNAPYDDKIRFVKYCMAYHDLVNAQILANISFLVFGKKITDEVFSDEKILFTNLEEYVDAKYDLKTEIEAYSRDLLKFYLASIKSLSVILPDGKIDIPASYYVVLTTADMHDISKLMNRYTLDTKDIPLVYKAEEVIRAFMFSESPTIQGFIKDVLESLRG